MILTVQIPTIGGRTRILLTFNESYEYRLA